MPSVVIGSSDRYGALSSVAVYETVERSSAMRISMAALRPKSVRLAVESGTPFSKSWTDGLPVSAGD